MDQKMTNGEALQFNKVHTSFPGDRIVDLALAAYEPQAIGTHLLAIDRPLYVIELDGRVGLISADCDEQAFRKQAGGHFIAAVPALSI